MFSKSIKNKIRSFSSYHKQNSSKNNVLLISTPRSGSTWLMEMIATQNGFRTVREPFNIRHKFIKDNIGINSWDDLYKSSNTNIIIAYLNKFMKNGFIWDSRYKLDHIFSEFWRPFTYRTLFKILHACENNLDILAEKLNAKQILLIRHPIPVALSREVFPRLEALMNSEVFLEFSKSQQEIAKKVFESNDIFKKSILDWTLQNAIAIKKMADTGLIVTYEQLVVNPNPVLLKVANFCSLENPDKMIKRLDKASGSSGKSNSESQKILKDKNLIVSEKEWLVNKWESKVTRVQLESAFEIIDTFKIDIYTKSSMPSEKYIYQ